MKDVLVATSVLTGVASSIVGRTLGAEDERAQGQVALEDMGARPLALANRGQLPRVRRLQLAVRTLGTLDLLSNVGIAAVTALLAIELAR